MQFLTTCLHCGQSIRKDATICAVCGNPPSVRPLTDAPYGARKGKERLSWAVVIGTGMEQTGYCLGAAAVMNGLGIVLEAGDARLWSWLGALTGACLVLIFTGRYMRDNLQHTSAVGLGALTHFMFRVYPAKLMIGLLICSAYWAFFQWLLVTGDSPTRPIAGWTFLTFFLIVFSAESLRSALADDDER